MHIPVFRVFYSTTFTVVLLLLLGLLLVSPADLIFQANRNHQLTNILVLASVYTAALLVSGFIYATRIYTTRTHLASIPRTRAPVKKGDVSVAVRRTIQDGLMRSATIAWNAHPKDSRDEPEEEEGRPVAEKRAAPRRPPWGAVEHPGWSSPSSRDLPGVQFAPVIAELVHLLEAKAVSLAPPDPLTAQGDDVGDGAGLPDAGAVALLQRPVSTGARDYLFQLMELGVIRDDELAVAFLKRYERARFSGAALPEPAFRALMNTFSALLGSLAPPSLAALAALQQGSAPTSSPPLTTQASTQSLRSSSRASSVLHRYVTTQQEPADGAALPSTTPGSERDARGLRGLHLTPYFTPRPGSVSSNDGDHDSTSSSGGSTSSSAHTIHTAWTRPSRSSRMSRRSVSRGTRPVPPRRHSSAYCTPRLESRHSSREDLDVVSVAGSDGSVVRRVRAAERHTPAAAPPRGSGRDYFGRWG